ncbi:hypothetical protein KBA73_02925 [Patescibacteria group bacterium]|nr:hypothetical protein [Patescibacteria group bacterium]
MTEPCLTDAPDYHQLLLTSTESTYRYGHGTGALSYVTYIPLSSLQAARVDDEGRVRVVVREGWQDFEQWGDYSWFVYDREYEMTISLARLQRLAIEARFQLPSSLAPVIEGPYVNFGVPGWRATLEVDYHLIRFTELWQHIHQIGAPGQADRWRGGPYFNKEEAYKKLSTTTRTLEFGVIEWEPRSWDPDKARELAASKGVRPAVFEELFTVIKAFPRVRGDAHLYAAGSVYSSWRESPDKDIVATPMIQACEEWRALHFVRSNETVSWCSSHERYLLVVTNDPSL